MAKFSRIEVALKMNETGMVPVFYHPSTEVCLAVARACYQGGIRVFEFTNRGDFAHEIFADLVKYARRELPELMVGAGSIVEAGTAALYIQLGADFIVSPLVNPEMARVCNRRKVLWSPGCGSVSEVGQAEELGAEVVKVFPGAQVGGPEFVKAVKGPCPWSSLMPTGGVSPDEANLRAWFKAGVHCVGMGSQLLSQDLVESDDHSALEKKIRDTLGLIKTIRKG
ncbi:MAG: bifunctional 4-hydroxy-2-oxoglutarate aldolase/2-dehydro-3-deoxy-phosphogluconate aldolase [Cytophagales bacterium]|nr:bifunctional 4-hydroxy-2-oxoglutarate aldolase/2-dehydro-3-deoxy-phosphogluconate aldolase [Cytophagales bacterium]